METFREYSALRGKGTEIRLSIRFFFFCFFRFFSIKQMQRSEVSESRSFRKDRDTCRYVNPIGIVPGSASTGYQRRGGRVECHRRDFFSLRSHRSLHPASFAYTLRNSEPLHASFESEIRVTYARRKKEIPISIPSGIADGVHFISSVMLLENGLAFLSFLYRFLNTYMQVDNEMVCDDENHTHTHTHTVIRNHL